MPVLEKSFLKVAKARRFKLLKRLLRLRRPRTSSGYNKYATTKQMSFRCSLGVLLVAATASMFSGALQADNFAYVSYNEHDDELVVTMRYRGTNPNHAFLEWGPCKDRPDGQARDIVAEVLDSQWQDAALKDFKVTKRFSLADLKCRPASLTLRTAPRFYYTLRIPARG